MKKAMLSQPMGGKTDEEIVSTREEAVKVLQEKGYEIVNTLFTDEWYSREKMEERAMWRISARDGKTPGDAASNMKRQKHMD